MIGIFDSGVGGLTVVREIFKILPDYQIVYFGDTAHLPYGTKSKEAVCRYSLANAQFLLNQGAKIIVIACHTASSLAVDTLRKKFPKIPIFDVVKPGIKQALEVTKNKKIGIIGTSSTIRSEAHKKALLSLNQEVEVFSQACPLLVPLVEEGWINRSETRRIVKYYLRHLKQKQIDTLILACTHYPLLENLISSIAGRRVTLVDPAREVAKELKEFLEKNKDIAQTLKKGKDHKFFVSDVPYKFGELSRRCLGRVVKVEQIRIE